MPKEADKKFSPERSGADRRRARRHDDAFFVRVFLEGGEDVGVCEILDVSELGLGVVAPASFTLPEEGTVLVEMPLGRSSSRVQTRCIVRGVSSGVSPRVHLEFFDDSLVFRQILRFAIESWESQPVEDRRDRS